MKIKAKVSIQTKERMFAPGEELTIARDEGEKLIENGHATLVDDSPDPEPEPEPKQGGRKPADKPADKSTDK